MMIIIIDVIIDYYNNPYGSLVLHYLSPRFQYLLRGLQLLPLICRLCLGPLVLYLLPPAAPVEGQMTADSTEPAASWFISTITAWRQIRCIITIST